MTIGHFPSSPRSLCEAVHSMILPISPKPQPPSDQLSLKHEPPPCLLCFSGTHPRPIFLVLLHFLIPFPPPASGLSAGTPQLSVRDREPGSQCESRRSEDRVDGSGCFPLRGTTLVLGRNKHVFRRSLSFMQNRPV